MHPGSLPRQEIRSPRLLPPIRNGDTAASGDTPVGRRTESWSRYHSGCTVKHPLYLDWSAVRPEKKMGGIASRCTKAQSVSTLKEAEQQENVAEYLDNNQEFLENYVCERVDRDVLEKWLVQKTRQSPHNKSSKRPYKDPGCYKNIFMELITNLKDDPNEHTVLWELAKSTTACIGVDAYRVYKLFPDHPTFAQFFHADNMRSPSKQLAPRVLVRADHKQVALVLEVAQAGTCRRLARVDDPNKFPEMASGLVRAFGIRPGKIANHVMYQPILTKAGKTGYLIEMWRLRDRFNDLDEQICSNFLVWGSLAVHYCNLFMDKRRERSMSDFLLDVVKAIFEEMVSLDQVIKRILEFAQKLVSADRASLFLVDHRNYELVSTVFDLKFDRAHDRDVEKKEIRMPIHRGIAGFVALSAQTVNIPDAYSDYRFNREVDEATGYKTISILCMPIKIEGRVIGVVQMVNKRYGDTFGHEDEAAFEIFSTFFGLALHHARLYDRIMRKEQKYRVALEVLSYHNTCKENEVQEMLSSADPVSVDLDNFYLDSFQLDELQKCKSVITMFDNLFDMSNFDLNTMTRFILTVKKNYRTVPYHNFDHGWSVAHAMYVILKNDVRNRFNYKMRLALFVACICHDLDHRGYTNKYMSETASPLAAMYTTSTLEHHHFNITVTILQQDGHNIFSHISSQEYKEILGLIKHCILATDLAAFFPNLEKIKELFVEDKSNFNWRASTHRDLAMAISMTAADLSASAKPWEVQIKTVKVIFEEFYDQGDKERAAGREPIPMMDRHKPDEQPSSQVGFLSQICVPCYDMLHRILPNTKPMYSMAKKNLQQWKSRADEILTQKELKEKKDEEEKVEEVIKDLVIKREDARKETVRPDSKTIISEARSSVVSWDEEEEFINEEEVVRSEIWKDIEGVTWIEDDPVLQEDPDSLTSIKILQEKE